MANSVSYAQAVAQVRGGLNFGTLVGDGMEIPLGANREPTQEELLGGVLLAASLFTPEQEIENSYADQGVSAAAVYSEDYGHWQVHTITWLYDSALSLSLEITGPDDFKLSYGGSRNGALTPEMAAWLARSRWVLVG